MKVFRIIVGIFGVLLALSAGGCGLFFLPIAAKPDGTLMVALISGVPTLIGISMAMWGFRGRA